MLETKLTVLITKDLRQQAKAAAVRRGETLSNVVRSALVEYVEETTRQDAKQEDVCGDHRREDHNAGRNATTHDLRAEIVEPRRSCTE